MLAENNGHSNKSTQREFKNKDTIEELLGLDTDINES
jgi:hypothetical protein